MFVFIIVSKEMTSLCLSLQRYATCLKEGNTKIRARKDQKNSNFPTMLDS